MHACMHTHIPVSAGMIRAGTSNLRYVFPSAFFTCIYTHTHRHERIHAYMHIHIHTGRRSCEAWLCTFEFELFSERRNRPFHRGCCLVCRRIWMETSSCVYGILCVCSVCVFIYILHVLICVCVCRHGTQKTDGNFFLRIQYTMCVCVY
jgi:hypothetical protein